MIGIKINVKGTDIVIFRKRDDDYISLTDIAKYKNNNDPRYVIQNWMKTKFTVEFLGIWEQIHNRNFNRVEFDAVKAVAGNNTFVLTPQKWIEKTSAIGVVSKSGRYGGGTFAHKDIAFEFASWVSPEFKLYLIKEFQRLKEQENSRLKLNWDIKRNLAKINYKIHTDSIKDYLIPNKVTHEQINFIYSNEADILNKALFSMTSKEWHDSNPDKKGNIRDYANAAQLVCLSNLESFNAEFIRQNLKQSERLVRLNKIAIFQMKSLINNSRVKKLENL